MSKKLVSNEYRAILHEIHRTENWGIAARFWYFKDIVADVQKLGLTELLDYGAGAGRFKVGVKEKNLGFDVLEYEPGIMAFATNNKPRDYLVCCDVLEHVEPELLENVLNDMARCMKVAGFITTDSNPATKTLPDGRNAHLIQEDHAWWDDMISRYFHIRDCEESEGHKIYYVECKHV